MGSNKVCRYQASALKKLKKLMKFMHFLHRANSGSLIRVTKTEKFSIIAISGETSQVTANELASSTFIKMMSRSEKGHTHISFQKVYFGLCKVK